MELSDAHCGHTSDVHIYLVISTVFCVQDFAILHAKVGLHSNSWTHLPHTSRAMTAIDGGGGNQLASCMHSDDGGLLALLDILSRTGGFLCDERRGCTANKHMLLLSSF